MTILYRLTRYSTDGGWTVRWETTKDGARREFLRSHKAGIETVVHRADVPTDKAGLAEALNQSFDNPVSWPWVTEEIFSSRKEMSRRAATP